MKSLVFLSINSFLISFSLCKIFYEEFFDHDLPLSDLNNWVIPKNSDSNGRLEISSGNFFADKSLNRGLRTTEDYRFYSISSKFNEPYSTSDSDLILQFTVKHEQKLECGGGYVKLLPATFNPKEFNGETPYVIMFGPDLCGKEKRVHVIINYDGKNYQIKKKIDFPSDQSTHLYTLIIDRNQDYIVKVDNKIAAEGSLVDDWEFLPQRKINDPNITKPEDWEEEEEIVVDEDPIDIPRLIKDPSSKKPDDWNDDLDGEWKHPEIINPLFVSKKYKKKIQNPKYKGSWIHPQIDNPTFKKISDLKWPQIGYIGIELWQVNSGTIFDNFVITNENKYAEKIATEKFQQLVEKELEAFDSFLKATEPKNKDEIPIAEQHQDEL